MEYTVFTDVGKERNNNEDSLLLVVAKNDIKQQDNNGKYEKILVNNKRKFSQFSSKNEVGRDFLAIVSDGMGGYEAGEIASKIVCEKYLKNFEVLNALSKKEEIIENLKGTFKEADNKIYEMSVEDEDKKNMGATIVGLYYSEKSGFFKFHAGDSRLYLLNDGFLRLLTEDHNVYNSLLKLGQDPDKKTSQALTNCAAGGNADNFLEVSQIEKITIKENTGFFLCSDGIYDLLDEDDLEDELNDCSNNLEFVESISKKVYNKWAHDNFTGIFINHLKENHE